MKQRSFTADAAIKARAEDARPLPELVGYAAVFDSWTTLYKSKTLQIREVVRPGAFRNALAENQDVRALWNHEADGIIGRTSAGTLRLAEDAHGLAVGIDPPDDHVGRRVSGLVGRRDVAEMSFAFLPRPGGERQVVETVDDVETISVEILDVDLFDVAPVVWPAYLGTEIAQARAAGFVEQARRRAIRRRLEQVNLSLAEASRLARA